MVRPTFPEGLAKTNAECQADFRGRKDAAWKLKEAARKRARRLALKGDRTPQEKKFLTAQSGARVSTKCFLIIWKFIKVNNP